MNTMINPVHCVRAIAVATVLFVIVLLPQPADAQCAFSYGDASEDGAYVYAWTTVGDYYNLVECNQGFPGVFSHDYCAQIQVQSPSGRTGSGSGSSSAYFGGGWAQALGVLDIAGEFGNYTFWRLECIVCSAMGPIYYGSGGGAVTVQYQISLTATGTQEDGKSTHFLSLKNSGNVVISAAVSPNNPAGVSWSGGSQGSNNTERVVSTSSAGDTSVVATVPGGSATVVIHVVDATAPPQQNASASKTPVKSMTALNPQGWGITAYSIGSSGITRPDFEVNPYFSGNKWVFRLASITHTYKQGIFSGSSSYYDLNEGNPATFPGPANLTLTQKHTLARSDFDTTGLVPAQGGAATGPPMTTYWSSTAVQAHEDAHVRRFYVLDGTYWLARMNLFESEDVEASTVFVTFDCNTAATTTGTAATNLRKGDPDAQNPTGWYASIEARHNNADGAELNSGGTEAYAHSASNPIFAGIRNNIPNP